MSIVYSNDSGITYWPLDDIHDVSSSKYYTIDYRPDVWVANKAYIKDLDLVIPLVENGCMYECVSGGISGATAPTFLTLEGRTVKDNDVLWRCLPYAAKMGYGDIVSSSTWTSSSGVSLSNDELIGGKTTLVKVAITDTSLQTFDLVNSITINRSSGRVETFKKTLRITIGNT